MSSYIPNKLEFGETPLIMPVIHFRDETQALRSAEVASKEQVDGIWLIDHSQHGGVEAVFDGHLPIRMEFPGLWSGVNCLGVHPERVFELVWTENYPVDGIWADDALISRLLTDDEQKAARRASAARDLHGQLDIKYFGGVAHKGTPTYTNNPQEASDLAFVAMPFVDVVTTSGPGTNMAASPKKIKAMHERLNGRLPLALASGVAASNVHQYVDNVDAILVASSIESDDGQIDRTALHGLVQAVRNR